MRLVQLTKQRSISAITAIGPTCECIDPIINTYLQTHSDDVKSSCYVAFLFLDTQALPHLMKMIRSQKLPIQDCSQLMQCITSIVGARVEISSGESALKPLPADGNPSSQIAQIVGIGIREPIGQGEWQILRDGLNSLSFRVRIAALNAIECHASAAIDSSILEAIAKCYKDDLPIVRMMAVRAIGAFRKPSTIACDVLHSACKDQDECVRVVAAGAIRSLQDPCPEER